MHHPGTGWGASEREEESARKLSPRSLQSSSPLCSAFLLFTTLAPSSQAFHYSPWRTGRGRRFHFQLTTLLLSVQDVFQPLLFKLGSSLNAQSLLIRAALFFSASNLQSTHIWKECCVASLEKTSIWRRWERILAGSGWHRAPPRSSCRPRDPPFLAVWKHLEMLDFYFAP